MEEGGKVNEIITSAFRELVQVHQFIAGWGTGMPLPIYPSVDQIPC